MTFSEKIDEWIKEAETRPGSALMILKLIAGRMRDLGARNEELLAENIALQDGSRVEEYQKRIAHLEYQLELLKRRVGSEDSVIPEGQEKTVTLNLLVYTSRGHILRIRLAETSFTGGANLGRLSGELLQDNEVPRLLALPEKEEVMLLFSSGRIKTLPVESIPAVDPGGSWDWDQAAVPDEPHAGELLVCLTPLSRLPVSDYLLQVSRRGCVKKTLSSIADKILSSHYLGRGAIQKVDQPLDLQLGLKKNLFMIVTYEGRIIGLDVDGLSYTAEERIKLHGLDHVVAGFVPGEKESVLCLTQTGKVIVREVASIELGKTGTARGQALISPSRLDQGTRFIGAMSFHEKDSLVVLDVQGNLSLHCAGDVSAGGSLHLPDLCLSLGLVPSARLKGQPE